MGNEDDAEHVDTDWSGRPVELKRTDGAKLDGTGPLFTDLVVEVINGRDYMDLPTAEHRGAPRRRPVRRLQSVERADGRASNPSARPRSRRRVGA